MSHDIYSSAAYLNGWITKLRGDRRLLVQAGAAAQRAVDLIVGKAPAVMGGADTRQDDRGAP